MTLLHIDSSADAADDSVTRRLTGLFAATWRARNPASGYVHRDVCAEPVPALGPAYTALGRRVEREGLVPPEKVPALIETSDEGREWDLTLPLITELRAADTVLLGVPMYNLAVPATLKAWIDRVTFPGAYADPGTGESLLRETRVIVVMARGGGYGPGTPREPYDFQTPYLKAYFGELGVRKLHLVAAELTLAGLLPHLAHLEGLGADSLARARAEVRELAALSGPAAAGPPHAPVRPDGCSR